VLTIVTRCVAFVTSALEVFFVVVGSSFVGITQQFMDNFSRNVCLGKS